ncbi:hypothetical protein R69749_06243 [Paraburkholderia domus]|nr:hypothetical protein R69749_06243 [Paraburkholderia domus]
MAADPTAPVRFRVLTCVIADHDALILAPYITDQACVCNEQAQTS